MLTQSRWFALAAVILTAGPAAAQAPSQPVDTLPSCDAWLANRISGRSLTVDPRALARLKAAGVSIEPSRRMRAAGYPWEHQILVALPPSYGRTDQRYPVLWVTDGQFFFSAVTEVVTSCAGKHLPEMIVVAVGATPEADQARNEIQSRRTFDYSPNEVRDFTGFGSELHRARSEAAERRLKAEGKFGNDRMGGAPRFLAFIAEDIRGQLAREYRMADDHTLFGHSGGGLFCAYALTARPSTFQRYVCGSPSPAGAPNPSLQLHARIFPGESHGSVIPLVLSWGLRCVLEKYPPGQTPSCSATAQ
ncbi:MAG: alpha/beta hydrolase [Gemmatimonadales bacterium]|nr:alpha/beta hydrolase [Gemmatimonadales bacterium]